MKKFEMKIVTCILLGYANNHATDPYCLYNPETKYVTTKLEYTCGGQSGKPLAQELG